MMLVNACELCGGNCYGCLYADACGVWNDTDISDIPQVEVEEGGVNHD